ncbi:hypothetical protein HDU98_004707 [Podochytrium sp. JEL0797]|nr:hypothetical protein HDU98_004707 [Podochytrium sp. JEL0797]
MHLPDDASDTLRQLLQRMPGTLVLLVVPFLMVAPFYFPLLFSYYYGFLMLAFVLFAIRSGLGVVYTLYRSVVQVRRDWAGDRDAAIQARQFDLLLEDGESQLAVRDIFHVVVIPNYKESIETLTETLDVLASHPLARTNYKVCLAMEATEDGCEQKAVRLTAQFDAAFHTVTYTVHPKNLPGEIRGKSSNSNWACTQLFHRFAKSGSLLPIDGAKVSTAATHPQDYVPISNPAIYQHIFTCIDADTCFAADYFTTVAYEYTSLSPHGRKAAMFIPSIVFDRNSDKVNALVRVMDISWSASQLSYFLPNYPFKPATSAYSVPMEMARAVGFWDTTSEALGEDYHMTIKCAFATSGRLRIIPIFSPASQFNVCGDKPTFISGCFARLQQLRRHMWGSLDLGYTFRMAFLWLIGRGIQLPATYFEDANGREPYGTRIRQFLTIFFTMYTALELFVFSTHALLFTILVGVFVPFTAASPPFFAPISKAWWLFLTGSLSTPMDPIVQLIARFATFCQIGVFLPVLITFVLYEMYYRWISQGRWIYNNPSKTPGAAGDTHPVLGKRPATISGKRSVWGILEFPLYPIAGFVTASMLLHTTTWQIVTDKLEYQVAAKPSSVKKTKGM